MALVNLLGKTKRVVRSSRLEVTSITTLYGDVELDLSQAPLQPGGHDLRIVNICGHVKLRVPEHVGIQLDAMAVLSELETEAAGGAQAGLEHDWLSENIDRAAVRIVISFRGLLAGLRIVRVRVGDVYTDPQLAEDAAKPHCSMLGYEGETRKLDRVR